MDDLIIYNSKFKYIPLLLGSIGFVVAGIFCISIGRSEIGWVTLYAYYGESMVKRRKHLDFVIKTTSKILE